MAETSTIEWTDATWNPVTGCSVVSLGCTNCYAMGLAGTRLKHHPSRAGLTVDTKGGPVWNGTVRLNEEWLTQPLRWKRPRMIFVCAHGDLFHESVPDEWIDRVFAVMALCPQHTFQVLTKRSARMRAHMAVGREALQTRWLLAARDILGSDAGGVIPDAFPLSNVWLGVSTEDQRRADERVPDLLATPAAVRFVSAEPLLGPVDFTRISLGKKPGFVLGETREQDQPETFHVYRDALKDCDGAFERLDQVIVGGESGPGARPMHPAWARSIRDQCVAAGVPYFFKQWGAWAPRAWCRDGGTHALNEWSGQISFQKIQSHPDSIERVGAGDEWSALALVGKSKAGRLLDGVEHNGMPEVRV